MVSLLVNFTYKFLMELLLNLHIKDIYCKVFKDTVRYLSVVLNNPEFLQN